MTICSDQFCFSLTLVNREGIESNRSYQLPLDGNHLDHFKEFLSQLTKEQVMPDQQMLTRISQEYCLALVDKKYPDFDGLSTSQID